MSGADIATALHARRSGGGWIARCPAHEDRSPSLSITERDGTVLVKCHAGCDQAAVIDALRARGLWPERGRTPEERRAWAQERANIERDLPNARRWRRAVVALAEQSLDAEKAKLFHPTEKDPPDFAVIPSLTRTIERLQSIGDAGLVAEYREWTTLYPRMTETLVAVICQRERYEAAALREFLASGVTV